MPFDFSHAWFLTGPTASGKTAVAIALAKRIDAEIISLDSMAIYRGMDIGTAKPTAAEQAAVPHHLIDIVEPDCDYSVARYVDHAGGSAAQIAERGKAVLFAGGTPLYLKALLRGLFEGPPADWELRNEFLETAATKGPEFLHARLAEVDPLTAARLAPTDTRRVIRALEVWHKTGQPISQLQQQWNVRHTASHPRVFVLDWPRSELNERINARVDTMFAAGLVAEAQNLIDRQPPPSRTASQAVGYRQVIEHLAGERSLPETIELVKLRTRQFAKRQMTWFRSLAECRFVPCAASLSIDEVAATIAAG